MGGASKSHRVGLWREGKDEWGPLSAHAQVPFPMVLLSMVSATHCQDQSENIKWKIPEIIFLNFTLF
jgi:hypothetical protein